MGLFVGDALFSTKFPSLKLVYERKSIILRGWYSLTCAGKGVLKNGNKNRVGFVARKTEFDIID
jgi:hypothetical protein